jgi:hypothetical protein
VPGLKARSPKFKPQFHQKKKKMSNNLSKRQNWNPGKLVFLILAELSYLKRYRLARTEGRLGRRGSQESSTLCRKAVGEENSINNGLCLLWVYMHCLIEIFTQSRAPMSHTCNPSYSGGRNEEDIRSKSARANSSRAPNSKIPFTKKWWWGDWQSGLSCRS